ncbi:MATE family efflux transporter [bacterium LRH843]|nr:MATE family efflux transporter [bacterium LRH843]
MSKQHDFTQGNIGKQLIAFSGPIILTNLLQASYQFIDSLWVGNLLGANALGSVAVSSTIILTVLSFILGLNNAALTILSQQRGRGSADGLKRYLNAFVVIMTFIAIVLGFAGYFFAEGLLQLLGTPESMIAGATSYLRINFIGILFLVGYNFISTVLRAMGDSKAPLRFVSIAVALNIVLDPLFIAGFKWGIEGAAIATVFSQATAFLYGMVYVLQRKLAPFSMPKLPSWKEVKLILYLGFPASMQMIVITAGTAAILSVVTKFGGDVVAGFGAAQQLDSLILLPAFALGTAVSSMAGQNIGGRHWARVNEIAKQGVISNFLIMAAIGVFVIFFAEYGMKLFIRDEEAVGFGTRYLQIVALCYPFLGINFILNGILRATGAMYPVLGLNILSFWILRYPLTLFYSNHFGEIGIAMGLGTSFLISSIVAFLYYRFGKWREKDLFAVKGKTTAKSFT